MRYLILSALLILNTAVTSWAARAVMENIATTGNTITVDVTNTRVGIAKAAPAQALDVDGNMAITGTVDGYNVSNEFDGLFVDTGTNQGNIASNLLLLNATAQALTALTLELNTTAQALTVAELAINTTAQALTDLTLELNTTAQALTTLTGVVTTNLGYLNTTAQALTTLTGVVTTNLGYLNTTAQALTAHITTSDALFSDVKNDTDTLKGLIDTNVSDISDNAGEITTLLISTKTNADNIAINASDIDAGGVATGTIRGLVDINTAGVSFTSVTATGHISGTFIGDGSLLTGVPGADVTLAGNNDFTGVNTFAGITSFGSSVTVRSGGADIIFSTNPATDSMKINGLTGAVTFINTVIVRSSGEDIVLSTNSITNSLEVNGADGNVLILGRIEASAFEVTGSSNTPPVANTLYKENVLKGWIHFNGTGAIAVLDSFNISSLTDTDVGDYTINWDLDFVDAGYVPVGSVKAPGTSVQMVTVATGYIDMTVADETATPSDSSIICIMVVGRQ